MKGEIRIDVIDLRPDDRIEVAVGRAVGRAYSPTLGDVARRLRPGVWNVVTGTGVWPSSGFISGYKFIALCADAITDLD